MKRWMKTGICALALGAMLSGNALAAELALSFDKQGTNATVVLQGAGTDRYAAEVTFAVSDTSSVQFVGKADSYAVTVDSANKTVTLYAASRNPLTVTNGALDLGTLTVKPGTEVKGPGQAIVLDRTLDRTTYTDVDLLVNQQTTDDDNSNDSQDNDSNNSDSNSDSSSSSTSDRTPTVTARGEGGQVKAYNDGRVVITVEDGYRIARILVNGQRVEISTELTGLKATDKVIVTFEKIPEEQEQTSLPFTDVQPTDWYADAVQFAVSRGLFQGMSETEFAPNVEMSRAMLVTVLYRMSGAQTQGNADFEDVSVDAWYAQAVSWAKANGVVSGVSDTQFDPDRAVTREQMATILCRYSQLKNQVDTSDSNSLQDFTDAAMVSDYAVSAMGWAVQNGLISGMGDQTLAPVGSATRAQVASILQRFIEKIEA